MLIAIQLLLAIEPRIPRREAIEALVRRHPTAGACTRPCPVELESWLSRRWNSGPGTAPPRRAGPCPLSARPAMGGPWTLVARRNCLSRDVTAARPTGARVSLRPVSLTRRGVTGRKVMLSRLLSQRRGTGPVVFHCGSLCLSDMLISYGNIM